MHSHTTIQAYQLRKGGTPARMAILRMIAAHSANNRNESTRLQPGDWRGARRYTLKGYAAAYGLFSTGMQDGDPVWYTHAGEEFRGERDSNTGFYTDAHREDRTIGIVARLPHGRFIAGYRWTSNDERVYFGQVFADEDDARMMGDEHARVFAEQAFEDSKRFQIMTLAELDVEGKTLEVQKAIALRHRAKFGGPDRVRDAIEALREARTELDEATRAYEA